MTNKLTLFSELPTYTRFVYYDNYAKVYIKTYTNYAVLESDPAQGIHPGHVLVFTFDFHEHDNPQTQVGYLHVGHFYCFGCIDKITNNPFASVYLVNIGSYKQSCHECKRRVVLGRTSAWVELFE